MRVQVVKTQVVELKLSGGMRRYFDSLEGRADILPAPRASATPK